MIHLGVDGKQPRDISSESWPRIMERDGGWRAQLTFSISDVVKGTVPSQCILGFGPLVTKEGDSSVIFLFSLLKQCYPNPVPIAILSLLIFKAEIVGDGEHKGNPSGNTQRDLWFTAEVKDKGL